jgi:hypothetical protein
MTEKLGSKIMGGEENLYLKIGFVKFYIGQLKVRQVARFDMARYQTSRVRYGMW